MVMHFLLGIFIVSLSCEKQMDANNYQCSTIPKSYLLKQKKNRSEFQKHFKILDSVVKASPHDTIYCCYKASVEFMVRYTKIEVSTDANIAGRSSFSKSDLERWHAWFDKKYKRKEVNL